MLGGRRPVGVDGGDVAGVGLAAPADHEPLDDRGGLVDPLLRDGGDADAAGGLRDVGQRHDGGPGELLAGLLVGDVQQRAVAPDGGEHRQRGLHVDPDVTGVHRDRERLGRGQAGAELAVDQQRPDVAEGHLADEVLDVDAAVAEGTAVLVRFGDLGLEGDDAFQAGYEVVGHLACSSARGTRARIGHGAHDCLPTLGRAGHARRTRGVAGVAAPGCGSPREPRRPERCQHGGVPDLSRMRNDYTLGRLREEDLAPTWVEQFDRWFADVVAAELPEPNAVVVATADADGAPDARVVLMKGYDEGGIIFGTSYASTKGAQLAVNPRAALVFPWHALQRQVRVTGTGRADRRHRLRRAVGPPAARLAAGRGRVGAVDGRRLPGGARRAGAAARRADAGGHGAAAGGLGRLPGRARRRWSSGRAARTGCTTGCGSCATTRRAAAGSSSGSPRERPCDPARGRRRREPVPVPGGGWAIDTTPLRNPPTGGCSGASPPRCSASR